MNTYEIDVIKFIPDIDNKLHSTHLTTCKQ